MISFSCDASFLLLHAPRAVPVRPVAVRAVAVRVVAVRVVACAHDRLKTSERGSESKSGTRTAGRRGHPWLTGLAKKACASMAERWLNAVGSWSFRWRFERVLLLGCRRGCWRLLPARESRTESSESLSLSDGGGESRGRSALRGGRVGSMCLPCLPLLELERPSELEVALLSTATTSP